jgi:hypothetical protein
MHNRASFIRWVASDLDHLLPTKPGEYLCKDSMGRMSALISAPVAVYAAKEYVEALARVCQTVESPTGIEVIDHKGTIMVVQITWIEYPQYVATNVRCVEYKK